MTSVEFRAEMVVARERLRALATEAREACALMADACSILPRSPLTPHKLPSIIKSRQRR